MITPELEQAICIKCGFCCDGTLFNHANLRQGEKGHLPKDMEENIIKIGDREAFILPCGYFKGKCSIYYEKKAIVCSSYRCQLLNDFSANRIDLEQALKIVESGKLMRNDIFKLYMQIFPDADESIFFRSVLKKLIVDQKVVLKKDNRFSNQEKIIIGKCNIFEALLIRYFKSMDDYNQMIETADEQSS